jgi:hypothetical protein
VGGPGSGNYYHWWRKVKKTVVEDCLSLDANRLAREGAFKAEALATGSCHWSYRSGRECSVGFEVRALDTARPLLRLWYTRSAGPGRPESLDYHVGLTATRPRFGGLRWWFLCPLTVNGRACGRRVGKLYLPPGASYFGCRHCHRLTYTSCQESGKYAGLYRHIAGNLGCDPAAVRRMMNRLGKRRG